jgi:hypothetical protein
VELERVDERADDAFAVRGTVCAEVERAKGARGVQRHDLADGDLEDGNLVDVDILEATVCGRAILDLYRELFQA